MTDRAATRRQLAAQYGVVRVLAEAESLAEATAGILQAICESLSWEAGSLWMADRQDNLLRCVDFWHSSSVSVPAFEAATRGTTFPPGTGLPGRVWVAAKPAWIPDVVRDDNFPRAPVAEKEGLHGAFGAPILLHDEVQGVIEFFSREIREPDSDLLEMMAAIGSQIGQFIERKQAEEAVRQRESTLRAVFAASPDVITMIGADGQIGEPSPAVYEILGYDAEEYATMDRLALVHPDDRERAIQVLRGVLRGGKPAEIRYRVRHADGHWAILETRQRAMIDAEGQPVGAVAVSRDVSERVALEDALVQAKEEAERARDEAERAKEEAVRANRAKSEFLSRMSHELRTPLNSVLGFGELLEMDDLDPEQRESVHHILKGGRHLLNLINEVLDIARIESGRMALSLEPVRVRDVVDETVELVRPLAAEAGIGLLSERVDGHAFVRADRQRLKQVLLNLLSNAVKFNRREGSVTVRCEAATEDRLRISVTDEGPGIAPELAERLFVPFERLGADREGIQGTGLGLALSKGLVEAMGGSISVESAPGIGSTFVVELSRAEPEVFYRDAGDLVLAEAVPSAGPSTLLYVEDNSANFKLIERALTHRPNVRLLGAIQGSLGIELARQHQPDLVLLDLNLPDIPGEEVLHLLRADPRTAQIPVVVLSADATPSQIRKLLAAGAVEYLTKPLEVRRFLEALDKILAERSLGHAG